MSQPIVLFPEGNEKTGAVYMTATPSLRWQGRVLQQAWQRSDGKIEWRDVPDADPFDQ